MLYFEFHKYRQHVSAIDIQVPSSILCKSTYDFFCKGIRMKPIIRRFYGLKKGFVSTPHQSDRPSLAVSD
jgi:hypothetical protein